MKDIEFLKKTDTSVLIAWKLPPQTGDLQVFVDIKCFKCKGSSCTSPCEKETYRPSQFNITSSNVTVEDLQPNTKYLFRISSKNVNSYQINKRNWAVMVKKVDTSGKMFV